MQKSEREGRKPSKSEIVRFWRSLLFPPQQPKEPHKNNHGGGREVDPNSLRSICRAHGVSYGAVCKRVRDGLSPVRAIAQVKAARP